MIDRIDHFVLTVRSLEGTLDFWLDGRATFDHYVSPWLEMVDDARFQRSVDRIAQLSPSAMAGCHTPAIRGRSVATAIESTRRSPSTVVAPQPDQAVLEEIQRALEPAAEVVA